MDFGRCGVEVLELQFSHFAAIHGVGVSGAEALYVEFDHAAADFLVRSEADADFAVLDLGMLHQILHGGHDFCHAGLVIGPQKGGAVGGDEGLAYVMQHFRKFFRAQLQAGYALEVYGAAVVVLDNLRLHIGPAGIGSGIHMGDEAHGRYFLVQVGRDGTHHIAVLVQVHLDTQGLKLVPEHLEQVPFLGGRRLGLGLLVTLRVYAHVA